ncbi:hypothetical protein DPMN_088384 [Dreissena polymorpha]|uniref:Uncharacterized protein n=1 Tax=Dreissena polymorpha TaxID=45954 RepID=A0A9D4QXU2_DREPO|nr:hypothetical protein DPMN_088384 [Dreissena polymorpha]
MIDSQLPYLVGIDDDILSTGIVIFNLKREHCNADSCTRGHYTADKTVSGEGWRLPRFTDPKKKLEYISVHLPIDQLVGRLVSQLVGQLVSQLVSQLVGQLLNCIVIASSSSGISQGSLNTLGSGYPSYSGLSRASSYNSIISSSDDTSYLSPQQARAYPK